MEKKNALFIGEKVYLVPIESEHIDLYYEKLQQASFDSYLYTGSKKVNNEDRTNVLCEKNRIRL